MMTQSHDDPTKLGGGSFHGGASAVATLGRDLSAAVGRPRRNEAVIFGGTQKVEFEHHR